MLTSWWRYIRALRSLRNNVRYVTVLTLSVHFNVRRHKYSEEELALTPNTSNKLKLMHKHHNVYLFIKHYEIHADHKNVPHPKPKGDTYE